MTFAKTYSSKKPERELAHKTYFFLSDDKLSIPTVAKLGGGGGVVREVYILYPKESQLQNLSANNYLSLPFF